MPANLTPQYFEAEKRYKAASSVEERIEALEEMIAIIPKHKGTDKLQGDLKKRLSKLRANKGKKGGPSTQANPYKIERGGAGIVAMVGPPNSGKSSILGALSNAEPEIAPYPFTHADPLSRDDPLRERHHHPGGHAARVAGFPGSRPAGIPPEGRPGALRDRSHRSRGARPDRGGAIQLEDAKIVFAAEPGEAEPGKPWPVKTIAVLTKMDREGADEEAETLRELYPDYRYLSLSVESGEGLEDFCREVFLALDVVRAYTKKPGGKPEYNRPCTSRRDRPCSTSHGTSTRTSPKTSSSPASGARASTTGRPWTAITRSTTATSSSCISDSRRPIPHY